MKQAIRYATTHITKAMTVEQVTPAARALEGVGMGDILRHFRVASDGQTYWVAVLKRGAEKHTGIIRTCYTCFDGFMGFADADRTPCCKHAVEALRYVREEL
jgi:hypothetical protein